METDGQRIESLRVPKSGSTVDSREGKRAKGTRTRPPKVKHYEIDIFSDWCKCCGICAAFCPRQCIRLNEEGAPAFIDADQCTGCGWCEFHCPDFAISVHEKNHSAGAVDLRDEAGGSKTRES